MVNKKNYWILVMSFLVVLLGAIMKIAHSSYADGLLLSGMLIAFGGIVAYTRRMSIAALLTKFRWYFLFSSVGLLLMGLLVKSGGYANYVGSFIGGGVNFILFITSFIVTDNKKSAHS